MNRTVAFFLFGVSLSLDSGAAVVSSCSNEESFFFIFAIWAWRARICLSLESPPDLKVFCASLFFSHMCPGSHLPKHWKHLPSLARRSLFSLVTPLFGPLV